MIEPEQKARLLERMMHEDPTNQELIEMWHDRPRLERLATLRDNRDYSGPDYVNLQSHDFELWRCKMRAEPGSLLAHIYAFQICEEHCLLLSVWLHQSLPSLLISLSLPESSRGYKQARSSCKAEAQKLKMQKRAEIVHQVYRQKIWPNEILRNSELDHVKRRQLEAIGNLFTAQKHLKKSSLP